MNTINKNSLVLKLQKSEKITKAQEDAVAPNDWLNNADAPQYDIGSSHGVDIETANVRQINISDLQIKFDQQKISLLDVNQRWVELKNGDLISDTLSNNYEAVIILENTENLSNPVVQAAPVPKVQHLDIWGAEDCFAPAPLISSQKNTNKEKILNSALSTDVHGYHQTHQHPNLTTADATDSGIIPTNIPSQLSPVNPGLNSALTLDPISHHNQLTLNQPDEYSLAQTGFQDNALASSQTTGNEEGNILRDLGISQDVVLTAESDSSSSQADKNFMQQTPLDLIDDIWQEDAALGCLNANALVDAKNESVIPSAGDADYPPQPPKKQSVLFLQRLKTIAHKIIN